MGPRFLTRARWHIPCLLLLSTVSHVLSEDSFGSWDRTLRPLQAHACDRHELRLSCPAGTLISVHYVWYGRQRHAAHLCGPAASADTAPPCNSHTALQEIQRRCHGERVCRLLTSPDTFGREDPCPGVGKYAEVIYKCRPHEFQSKVRCEGDVVSLSCPPGQGLTIFSAVYGTSKDEVAECPQPDGLQPQECQTEQAEETLRKLCSGRQNCSLQADDRMFGDPHCAGRKFLKYTYNCIQKELLLLSSGRPAVEQIQTTSFPGWARAPDPSSTILAGDSGAEQAATDSSLRLSMQSDEVPLDETPDSDRQLVGFVATWMKGHRYAEGNKVTLITYVGISMGLGLVLFVTVVVGRVVIRRLVQSQLHSNRSNHSNRSSAEDDEFFSESDLESPENLPPPPVPVYATSSRRKSSDAVPRAPVGDTGSEVIHYFS